MHFFNGGRALYEGKLEQALTLYRQARSIAEAIGEPGLNVDARLGVSRCLRAQGNASAARDWADDAYKVTCRVKCLYAQGMALIERGRTAWESGDVQAAEADFRNAIEVTTRIQADFYLTRATFLLAGLLHRRNSAQARPVWLDAARWIISGGYAFLLEQERALAFPLVAAYLGDADSEMAGLSATLLEQLARVPPPSLRIVMLGRLEVWQGTRHIESRALRQRRAGELLALLLTAPGHALAADQVAEALSPDKSPEAAQIVVHHATSELRRILEPELPDRRFSSRYLEATDRLISLHLPPGSWLDTEAFEQAVQARDWEQALALYGGEFLPEYRYADWAAVRRERLAEDYRTVLLALAEARLAEKDWTAALDFARRLITRDPWHEGAVMAAMRACQGLNDLSAARRYYKRLEKTLGEELDVQPQEELQTLYHSLDNRRRK